MNSEHSITFTVLAATIILACDCNSEHSFAVLEAAETTAQTIINGEDTPTLYPDMTVEQQNSIVSLFSEPLGERFCSGSVIAPRVVLTAAHCLIKPNFRQDPERFSVRIGPDGRKPLATHNVQEYFIRTNATGQFYFERDDPLGNDLDYSLDMAVIILKEEVSNITPLPLHNGRVPELFKQKVQAVGYGYVEPENGGSYNTERHWTTMTMIGYQERQIGVDGSDQTCTDHGDSGSPLLYDFGSGPEIIGVASTIITGSFFGMYTPLSNHEEWVRSIIEQYYPSECLAACADIECGQIAGCACSSCGDGFTCQNNKCILSNGGTGSSCYPLITPDKSCNNNADCSPDESCTRIDGSTDSKSYCLTNCHPERCSQDDPDSFCYTENIGASFNFCFVAQPPPCNIYAASFDSCLLPDGEPGRCLPLLPLLEDDEGIELFCYGYCQMPASCKQYEWCYSQHLTASHECEQICADPACGSIGNCDCGDCRGMKICVDNQCIATEIPDTSDNDPVTDPQFPNDSEVQKTAKRGCNSEAGNYSLGPALILAGCLCALRRRKKDC